MRNPICKKYIRTSAVIQCNTASDNISAESFVTVLLWLSDKQVAFRYSFLLDLKSFEKFEILIRHIKNYRP